MKGLSCSSNSKILFLSILFSLSSDFVFAADSSMEITAGTVMLPAVIIVFIVVTSIFVYFIGKTVKILKENEEYKQKYVDKMSEYLIRELDLVKREKDAYGSELLELKQKLNNK